MNKFNKIIEQEKASIINTLVELLQIPSVLDENTKSEAYPFGKEINNALDYMLNMAKKDGFETLRDGGYAGHISYGNKNGKLVGALCHLDVVPAGKNWHYNPFEANIIDNKIYARGSTDDKGPTVAAYYALKIIKDAGIKLKNEIRIILGTDEETGWRGVKHYFQNNKMPDLGFAPDCNFPLVYGEKGRMTYDLGLNGEFNDELVVSITGGERYNVVLEEVNAIIKKDLTSEYETFLKNNNLCGNVTKENDYYKLFLKGKAAHAMEPQCGINAGTYMCDFLKNYTKNPLINFIAEYFHLSHYCEKMGLDYNDYEMGPITCNMGIMDLSTQATRITLDLRYPVRYDTAHFENEMERMCSLYGIKILNHTIKAPHYVSPDDDLVKLLYKAYVNNTGDLVNKPFTVGGGTYASMMPKAVAFGMVMPNEPDLAHQADEYISIDTLLKGIAIYIDAFLALGEVDA